MSAASLLCSRPQRLLGGLGVIHSYDNGHVHSLLWGVLARGVDLGEGRRDLLQGLALGVDADQHAVEGRPGGPDDLGKGEEHRERLGPDLDREDLADREVAGARPADAKKKTTIQMNTWPAADSAPDANSHALKASKAPEIRYVPEIIFLRPRVSNR